MEKYCCVIIQRHGNTGQHWATLGASNSGKNVHRLANYQVELFFAIIRIRRWASNLGQKKIEKGKQQQLVAVGASGKTLSLGSNPLSPSFVDTRPSAPSLCECRQHCAAAPIYGTNVHTSHSLPEPSSTSFNQFPFKCISSISCAILFPCNL